MMEDTLPRKYSLLKKPQSNATDNVETYTDDIFFYNLVEV